MAFFKHRAKTPEFVFTDGEWQTFNGALANSWVSIAAHAWQGYQTAGRGFVVVNFGANALRYLSATSGVVLADRDRVIRDLRNDCKRYNPEREIVLLVQDGARDVKAARAGKVEAFGGVVPTPRGWASPPESHRVTAAYELGALQSKQ